MRFLDCLAYLDPDGAAPGAAASKAAMMAVTARTGSPSGISRPRRSEDIAARTPLPPTTGPPGPSVDHRHAPAPQAHRLP
jgi:hypothetical protein